MRKMLAFVLLALSACSSGGGMVFPTAAKDDPEARIPFAQYHGSIHDWHAVSDTLLYVQGLDRQWYQVNLFGPCIGLSFANRVAFLPSDPAGDFDRFSSIVMGRQHCKVASVKKVSAPTRAVPGAPAAPAASPKPAATSVS